MPTELTRGQRGPLIANDIVISVELELPFDLSAILLTDRGNVRSDADFVFYNQLEAPGIRLSEGAGGKASVLSVTLSRLPVDIAQVRVVLGLDDQDEVFDSVPIAVVSDGRGEMLYRYPVEGVGETGLAIVLELDQRGPGWQIRAVGQPYPSGFAALVTDHGITVNQTPIPSPVLNIPLMPSRTVDLVAGQAVVLRNERGEPINFIKMAVGWDPIREQGRWGMRNASIDLDAAALMFAGDNVVDAAYYAQLISRDGSIRHQGDNLTGEGEGDDEVITVDLIRMPAQVTAVVFIVTSYRGQTFEQLTNAYCRLVDGLTGAELARYDLLGGRAHTGMVMAKVFRGEGDWRFQAIGQAIDAHHPTEAVQLIQPYLR